MQGAYESMQAEEKESASGTETQEKRHISMEEFANRESRIFTNLAYDDTETQRKITYSVHKKMVEEGLRYAERFRQEMLTEELAKVYERTVGLF